MPGLMNRPGFTVPATPPGLSMVMTDPLVLTVTTARISEPNPDSARLR